MALLKDHLDFPDEVTNYISRSMFYELMNFTNFHLCKLMNPFFGNGLLMRVLESKKNTIIKHVIDNASCVTVIDRNGWSLINYLFCVCIDITLLNYFIVKYHLNLETEDLFKNRPIFYACGLGSLEKIKYLINKGVDLKSPNSRNHMPLHHACLIGTLEVIHFVLVHSIKLMDDDDIWLLIHILCRNRNFDIIKNILPRIKSLSSSINLHNNGKLCHQIDDDIYYNSFLEDLTEDIRQFIIMNC